MNLQERIFEVCKLKTGTTARPNGIISVFERECGFSNGSVINMTDNTRHLTLNKILNRYPDINPDFLYYGKLPIIRPADYSNESNVLKILEHKDFEIKHLEALIKTKDKLIEHLLKQ